MGAFIGISADFRVDLRRIEGNAFNATRIGLQTDRRTATEENEEIDILHALSVLPVLTSP